MDHHFTNGYSNGHTSSYSNGQNRPRSPTSPMRSGKRFSPILEKYDPPRRLGRKRIDQRRALDAIVYRIRSGCRWNHLPKEYPDDSSVHRTYQRWQRLGVLDRVMDTLGERRTVGVS